MVTKQNGDTKKAGAPPKFKRPLGNSKIFVVTAAQNATPVHEEFWTALMNYCAVRDAELLVIPLRYKNATSQWTASQQNAEWWLDPPAKPWEDLDEVTQARYGTRTRYEYAVYPKRRYLWNVRRKLNDNLVVLGDVRVQATAQVPLQGFESLTYGESGILGHTKVQFKTIPTRAGHLPKILTSTGAVTVKNYTDTGIGKKGEFHHTLGAVVVEVQNDKIFHMRQINAEKSTGAFYDIPEGVVTKFTPDPKGQPRIRTAAGPRARGYASAQRRSRRSEGHVR